MPLVGVGSFKTCGGVSRSFIPVEGYGGHTIPVKRCGHTIPVEECGGHSIPVEGCGGYLEHQVCGGRSFNTCGGVWREVTQYLLRCAEITQYLWRGVEVELREDPQLPAVWVDNERVGRRVAGSDGIGDAAVVVAALVAVGGDCGVDEGTERLVLWDGGGEGGVGQDGGFLVDRLDDDRDPGLPSKEVGPVVLCGEVWFGVV